MTDNLLDLPGCALLNRQETDIDIRLDIEYTGEEPLICPHCGSLGQPYKHGVLTQVYRDLPIRAKRVGLAIERQRYKCRDCGKTFMQPVAFLDEKRAATQRLVHFIEKQSLQRTFTGIANDTGFTEAAVRSIFKDYTRRLDRSIGMETPEFLGMDEVMLMKRSRGMITNVKRRTVIDLLPKRDQPTILRYLTSLSDKGRVQVVAMDMWKPYLLAVRQILPQALVVVDKFHVVKMANEAMDAVRKDVRAGLTDRQRRTLMHDRFILLHRERELKPHQILKRDAWFGAFPVLCTAYRLKEQFFDVWDAPTRQEAEDRYDDWLATLPLDVSWAFGDLNTAVFNWRNHIFNYWDCGGITNAYTEAANGLAKLIARNGRGYSFAAIRAKVVYGNGLKMTAKPKYDGRKVWSYSFQSPISADVESPEFRSFGNDISTLIDHLEHGLL